MGEVFETADVEAAEYYLRGAYGNSMRIGLRGQQPGLWREHASLSPQAQFQHVRVTMSLEFTSPPIGVLSIGHLLDGRPAYSSDGSDRLLLRGDVYPRGAARPPLDGHRRRRRRRGGQDRPGPA